MYIHTRVHMNICKRAIHFHKRALFVCQKSHVSIKEPNVCVSTRETLRIFEEEPEISTKGLNISTKRALCVHSKKTCLCP